jgi:hypothetical protein
VSREQGGNGINGNRTDTELASPDTDNLASSAMSFAIAAPAEQVATSRRHTGFAVVTIARGAGRSRETCSNLRAAVSWSTSQQLGRALCLLLTGDP